MSVWSVAGGVISISQRDPADGDLPQFVIEADKTNFTGIISQPGTDSGISLSEGDFSIITSYSLN